MSKAHDGPITDNLGAAGAPTRVTPAARRRLEDLDDYDTGFYPRVYRKRLAEAKGPFTAASEYDAATVHYEAASPLIGTAVHAHHHIREDIQPKLALGAAERFYEEDPETHRFLGRLLHNVLPNQSRYEFDINRPPDTTVYTKPSLAWGAQVWKPEEPLNQYEREFSLEKWYEFHTLMDCAVEDAISRFGFAVVFDFHSYNYQRKGYTDWRTDDKPVINVGTRHLNLDQRGQEIKESVVESLRGHTVLGEEALVQENGVFYGGYLNRRLSHLYGNKVVTLSVEYKKVYMDERTGELYEDVTRDLVAQMDDTIVSLADHLGVPVRDRSVVPELSAGAHVPPARDIAGTWPEAPLVEA
ncbi:MAG: N-formylglutamate amidohydrolase [Thermoplasmatota archaeon]